ncbi:hypothetical protein TcasGA2_TC013188 [Tribolium castaneum]|uniref:Uncharacterized protein n=1 Tax=Tribolium castaneum TaxID=7070 RepID=D6WN08_TRICA|nr:PREDICTED: nuclear pore complex protein Nup214 [Tribolium castaneum]EFA03254.1 hypothetical protein TcasGA2_TC013188 [Tribolium castaneum]|eukprot:XP_008194264.1 PREDICTED: nuclear pore complex protein Nup214 [Tribolium castaneum]
MSHYSRNNNSFVTPPRASFRRYSLADTSSLTPTRATSALYNNHLSTKIGSRSPGYTTRVVQYSEEHGRSRPSHQHKYNKLGSFPIVHFFKKELPSLKRKGSEGNISQMNSAELSRFNSPEQNRLLLEKIIKSSPNNDSISHKTETNTKSVLDALKEISRKRIHASEEDFILKDEGKRLHKEYDNEGASRKRLRQNSLSPSSRYSSISELIASHSSMDGYLEEEKKKENLVKLSVPPVTPLKTPPIVKTCVDVETQTIIPEPTPDSSKVVIPQKEEKENVSVNEARPQVKVKKASPLKIFDETPLETMRKNRLTALMGSVQNKNQKQEEETKSDEKSAKPLVSILSPTNKSPHKSNKHVTFDIPQSENSPVSSTTPVTFSESTTPTKLVEAVTSTSTAISTPIVSASVVEVPPMTFKAAGDAPPPAVTSTPPASKTISFGNTNTFSVSSTVTPTTFTSLPTVKPTEVKPTVEKTPLPSFSSPSQNFEPKTSVTTSNFTFGKLSEPVVPTQKGGFKFELKDATTSVGTSSPFQFKSPAVTTSAPAEKPVSTFGTIKPANSLQLAQVTSSNPVTTLPTFGVTTTSSDSPSKNFLMPSATMFSVNKTSSPTTSTFMRPPNPLQTANSSMFNPPPSSNKPSMFSFGSTSTATSTATFAPSFTPSTTPGLFEPKSALSGSAKPSLNFSAPNSFTMSPVTTSSSFALPPVTTTSAMPFAFKPTTSFSSTVASTTSTFSNPVFGTNTTANFGGGASGAKPVFGQQAATGPLFSTTGSSFGTTNTFGTTSAFGANNSSQNVFGAVATTTSSIFGGSNTFGTAGSSFGNSFGSGQSSAFNEPKSQPTPSFGTPGSSAFGVTTTASFGTNSTVFTTTASGFSASNNTFSSTFGSSSAFDKPAEAASPFGGGGSTFGGATFGANPPVTQSGVFAFGTEGTKPPVFSFGSAEPPKPSFNFTAGSGGFDAGKGFGGNPPPAFNPGLTPQFNMPAPVGTGMFNIGSGGTSTPNRSRTMHKTKRRT